MKMAGEQWEKIQHFKPHEWGQWQSVSAGLIFAVDALRDLAGIACVIHCAFATSGHSVGSAHYRGLAADLHLVGLSVVDQFLLAEKLNVFAGIGVYPHWNKPGLHVDLAEPGRRWIRTTAPVSSTRAYIPLDWANLKKECE